MKLLDTTFLIHYWSGQEAAGEYLSTYEDAETFLTTTINLKELAVGRRRQGQFDRQELAETFSWLEVVPFDVDAAHEAAALEADLWAGDSTRRQIDSLAGDVLIAGVARTLDATIVTRNTVDFAPFDGVETERY